MCSPTKKQDNKTDGDKSAEQDTDAAVSTLQRAANKISHFLEVLVDCVTERTDTSERIDLDALTVAQHHAQTSALVTANDNNVRIAARGHSQYLTSLVDRNRSQTAEEDEALKPDISGAEALTAFGDSNGKRRKGKRGSKGGQQLLLDDAKAAIQAKMEADFQQRLKRLSLRTGKPPEEVQDKLKLIPRAHVDQVMDRRAMKYAAINLVRKVQKPPKKKKSDSSARLASRSH